MNTPKLRMIAGPNGSGKSTLLKYLRENFQFPLGYCLDPDELDRTLTSKGRLDFGDWGTTIQEDSLKRYFGAHPLAAHVAAEAIKVHNNVLEVGANFKSGYFTTILCDFLRQQWLAVLESFTFETVMSHPDKIRLLSDARKAGYRTYLYYICTDSPTINRGRIANRVAQGEHDVPPEKIGSRYERSLSNLSRVIPETSRAYFFDNSGQSHCLIAEFEGGHLVQVAEELPRWFVESLSQYLR